MEKVCCRPVLEVVSMHRRWLFTTKWQWQQAVVFSALPSKYSCSSASGVNSTTTHRRPRGSKNQQFRGCLVYGEKYNAKIPTESKSSFIFGKNESDFSRRSLLAKFGLLRESLPQGIVTNRNGMTSLAEVDVLFPTLSVTSVNMAIMPSTLRIAAPSLKEQSLSRAPVPVAAKFSPSRETPERQTSCAATATLPPCCPVPLHGRRSELLRNSLPPPFSSSHRTLFISHAHNDPAWRDSMCISLDSEDREGRGNVDDVLFDMFKDEATERVHMGRFIAALTETGLRRTDPRLKEFRDNLAAVHNLRADHDESSITALDLTRDLFKSQDGGKSMSLDQAILQARELLRNDPTRSRGPGHGDLISSWLPEVPAALTLDSKLFRKVLRDNVVLISRALRHHFVIPQWTEFCSHIEDFYWAGKTLKGGHVASYIPQLARFNPDYWGVSVCSIDGQRYSIGDSNISFTTQSCSKPITYAIALNELGADTVHRYVGTEPSGRMFNAIVLDYNNKPHNPLVNAGAIVVSALMHQLVRPELASSEKFDFVQQYFSRLAGGEMVGFSNGTFLSERENADRNYALAYYMRENKCFPEKTDLTASLDLYFQSCSMEVTTESMAVMAATLANGGICPITGDQVLQPAAVRDVLSLMHSCGMYDYSGQFAFKVGLPAKSGVCGAVMLVIPNVMGICTWSPPLDALGNSVRGIKFAEKLVEMFNFHRYDNLRFAANKKDPRREKYETRGQKVVSLLFSASTGDVTAMRRYALSGLNMSECDYDGRTALHLAASEGHLDVAKFLLEKCRVNVTPMDRWKRTPADDAHQFGFTEVEQYLRDYAAEHPDQCGTDDMVKSPPPTIPEIPEDKIPSPDSTK